MLYPMLNRPRGILLRCLLMVKGSVKMLTRLASRKVHDGRIVTRTSSESRGRISKRYGIYGRLTVSLRFDPNSLMVGHHFLISAF